MLAKMDSQRLELAAARFIRVRDGRQAIGARLVQPAGVSGISTEGIFGTRSTYRNPLWEVHPITRIEVMKDGAWIDVDQLPRTLAHLRRYVAARAFWFQRSRVVRAAAL
jgi:hypothetical protein